MKVELTQGQIDGLIGVERVVVKATVHGVGCNDVQFQIKVDGKIVWQYQLWRNMLRRCFCEKYKAESPSYQDVTCCDEWLSFANFLEWVNKEVGYKGKPFGFDLDKDIIIKGNKVYCPEACAFVPKAINMLLVDCGSVRGKWPVGVTLDKRCGSFVARIMLDGKKRHLGTFPTPSAAFEAYKLAKEAKIKSFALKYRSEIKPAVFSSLISWVV